MFVVNYGLAGYFAKRRLEQFVFETEESAKHFASLQGFDKCSSKSLKIVSTQKTYADSGISTPVKQIVLFLEDKHTDLCEKKLLHPSFIDKPCRQKLLAEISHYVYWHAGQDVLIGVVNNMFGRIYAMAHLQKWINNIQFIYERQIRDVWADVESITITLFIQSDVKSWQVTLTGSKAIIVELSAIHGLHSFEGKYRSIHTKEGDIIWEIILHDRLHECGPTMLRCNSDGTLI